MVEVGAEHGAVLCGQRLDDIKNKACMAFGSYAYLIER